MKSSIKGLFVILAIVVSLVAVQSVCAADIFTVKGTIEEISTRPNKVVVDETDVFGVRINYLANQYNIDLETGIDVSIEVYEFECTDGTIKNMAYSITVDDITVVLRTVPIDT